MKTILQLLVADRPGVLDRIVGLIRRRNWNIDSLTVGDIGEGISQLTFLLEGRDMDMQSLGEHLEDMDAIRSWSLLSEETNVLREMLLFRIPHADRLLADQDGIQILDDTDGHLTCAYADIPSRVEAFVQLLRARQIPCARSGPLSLPDTQPKEQENG